MSKKLRTILFSTLMLFVLVLPLFNTGLAEEQKQYRGGNLLKIGNTEYVFATNREFVEILKVDSNNQLKQIGEIYLEGALCSVAHKENGQSYLFVSTGGHIYKINVSNPYAPFIEIDRYVYEWRRWRAKIGWVQHMAVTDDFLFVGSKDGVKAMGTDNLIVEKEYTVFPAYGVAANDEKMVMVTEGKAMVFDANTTEKIAEYEVKNSENSSKNPAIDSVGNIYIPSDNSLIKVNKHGDIISQYFNPVPEGRYSSYSADVLRGEEIYYVNGYGVTSLNEDLKKNKFFFSANGYEYGPNSWAINVSADRDKVLVFNKTSIILLNDNLDFLSQYTYSPKYNKQTYGELKMTADKYFGGVGETVRVKVYGFWPNEEVKLEFGEKTFKTEASIVNVKVNSLGAGVAEIIVPESERGVITLKAEGLNSDLKYEISFKVQ